MQSEGHPIIKSYNLAIGTINIYDEHSHELIAHEGKLSKEEVEAYYAFIKEHSTKPYRILVNKLNSYSYSFDALEIYRQDKSQKVYALVTYNKAGRLDFESDISFSTTVTYAIFKDKDKALSWLLKYPLDQIV